MSFDPGAVINDGPLAAFQAAKLMRGPTRGMMPLHIPAPEPDPPGTPPPAVGQQAPAPLPFPNAVEAGLSELRTVITNGDRVGYVNLALENVRTDTVLAVRTVSDESLRLYYPILARLARVKDYTGRFGEHPSDCETPARPRARPKRARGAAAGEAEPAGSTSA